MTDKVMTVTYYTTEEATTYNIPYDEEWYNKLLKANGKMVNEVGTTEEETNIILAFTDMVSGWVVEDEDDIQVDRELVGTWACYKATPNTPFTSVGVFHIGFIF